MLRRWLILGCLLLILPIGGIHARELLSDSVCVIDANNTIQGSVFALCEELTIDGTVRGDVFAATVRTTINGQIEGSVYAISGQLDIRGQVAQDVHFGGAVLRVNPPQESETSSQEAPIPPPAPLTIRSIKMLALSTKLYPQTTISNSIVGAGYQLIIDGDVHNEINYWGSTLIINGYVESNVFAIVGDPDSDSSQIETLLLPLMLDLELVNPGLTVGESAVIEGILSYRGPVEGMIAGTLTREVQYTAPEAIVLTLDEPGFVASYLEVLGSEFSTLLIIGLSVMFFGNKFLQAPVTNLRTRPFASLAVGMLGFLLSFPVVLIILVLSLSLLGFLFILGFRGVVIAIALVLGLVNVGAVSIFYFMAIFVTRSIVGLAIGRFILRVVFRRNDVDDFRGLQYLALLIGVFLIAATASLPIVGIIINATALFLGLGALMIVISTQFERLRTVVSPTMNNWYTPSPAIIREHRIAPGMQQATIPYQSRTVAIPEPEPDEPSAPDDRQRPLPGTNNLPEGFDWEFFED